MNEEPPDEGQLVPPTEEQLRAAAEAPENPAPESPDAPGVNFTNRVTGKVQITGEEPVDPIA